MVVEYLTLPLVVGLLFRPKHSVDEFIDRGSRVRCPSCRWEPAKSDRWCCAPGCGHVWNTFETEGVCPGCNKRWKDTACLRCSVWSPHEDWYELPKWIPR